ncbi:Ig-like domain-containing protein [Levilactobacillus bambusae]|uniref:Bacterial Ig domain-containing protein n=1 Tax=Levilactobacillus bambusae TaxID=2024736 RepID=A0A2V1MYH9_9LACO|nr:Ig-like domain-containing protein [Levilactobacillus bambusae]PWF99871.1 hypothetical protein DCM90_07365 [Levilactobacillus bambusae]
MKKQIALISSLAVLATVGGVATSAVTAMTPMTAQAKHIGPSLSTAGSIKTSSTSMSGTATKGSKIEVKANNKKVIAKTTASKKTGKWTVKIAKQSKSTRLYVYAINPKTKLSFYNIVHVNQAAKSAVKTSTSKKTSTKTTTKKNTSKSTVKTSAVNVQTPTGTWKSNTSKGAYQVWSFSQKTGLNEKQYQKGKKTKTLLSYATYKVSPKTTSFWKMTQKAKGAKKATTFYVKFTSNKKFHLVNSKGTAVKTTYNTFTKTK